MLLEQMLGSPEDVAFVDLDRNDIVRHALVGKIVDTPLREKNS